MTIDDNNPTYKWTEDFREQFVVPKPFEDTLYSVKPELIINFISALLLKERNHNGFHCMTCGEFKLTGVCVGCRNRYKNKALAKLKEDILGKLPPERPLQEETKPAGGYQKELEELHQKQGHNRCREEIIKVINNL